MQTMEIMILRTLKSTNTLNSTPTVIHFNQTGRKDGREQSMYILPCVHDCAPPPIMCSLPELKDPKLRACTNMPLQDTCSICISLPHT
eukprot:6328107-Amphidinium_carterae.1